MTTQNPIAFPCTGIPEEPRIAKLVGLHPQRQDGLWMQRVRVPGGVLSAPQWRALAAIARGLTPETPLHLTTRQDVQLHDIAPERVGAIHRALADAGLSGVGAGGDTLRNITVCPCSGLRTGMPDLLPLALQIQRTLETTDGIYALPRKFKISLSCSESCGQPWINDLGLVAQPADGACAFRVIVAGSLGPKPGPGMLLFESLPARDVPALALAALRVFAAHGDRQQRSRARLRHVRERLGDANFDALLKETFRRAKAEQAWPVLDMIPVANGFDERLVLNFANGHVTPDAAEALAQLALAFPVRIDNHHRVILFGRDASLLRQNVAALDVLAQAAANQPAVVACPGTRWCPRALADTNRLADRLRLALRGKLPAGKIVCVSGCPNGCAHSAVADVGLTGGIAAGDDRKLEVYHLWTGGGMGRNDRLAQREMQALTADQAITRIVALAGSMR